MSMSVLTWVYNSVNIAKPYNYTIQLSKNKYEIMHKQTIPVNGRQIDRLSPLFIAVYFFIEAGGHKGAPADF